MNNEREKTMDKSKKLLILKEVLIKELLATPATGKCEMLNKVADAKSKEEIQKLLRIPSTSDIIEEYLIYTSHTKGVLTNFIS